MSLNPDLIGPVSPTPPLVYEPRLWAGRIWTKESGIAGIGFVVKCPYGQAVNLASILARACARFQITRYQYGPISKSALRRLDRASLRRPEDVLDALSAQCHINWAA